MALRTLNESPGAGAGRPRSAVTSARVWLALLGGLALHRLPNAPAQDPPPVPRESHLGSSRVDSADSFILRQWTTQHGLPQNTVTSLAQTRDGYLWFGTRYGLVRYDGVGFDVLLEELGRGAADAVDCRQLVADSDGLLWILTRAGLFACQGGRFFRPPLSDEAGLPFHIETIASGRSGGLWLAGADGVRRFRGGRLGPVFNSHQGFRREPITAVYEDHEGRLWLQFDEDGERPWQRFDPRTGEVRDLAAFLPSPGPGRSGRRHQAWESVTEDRSGRLWLGLPEELVCIEGERVSRFPAAGHWAGEGVRALHEDREGNLWIVTEGITQLHRFDGRELRPMVRFGGSNLEPDVRSILTDREGTVWVGSGSAGLYRIQQRRLLARLKASNSARDEVFSVSDAGAGGVWLGTPRGLLRAIAGGMEAYHESANPAGPRVKPVFVDRSGQVWLGILGSGLGLLDSGEIRSLGIKAPGGDTNWKVRALFEDREGTLWVGSNHGLLRHSQGQYRWLTAADGCPTNTVLGMLQDPVGRLWIGTEGGGMYIGQGSQGRVLRRADGLLDDRVWPLAVESDGAVWVGTPFGLKRIRGTEIRAVTSREGLHDNLAYSMLADDRGWYWSHCNRGLWRMRREDLNAVADGRSGHVFCISYDESDGMQSSEGNGDEQPSAARLANGELWFPTTRGVVIVDPARLRDNDVPPEAVVEQVFANGQLVFDHGRAAGPPPSADASPVSAQSPGPTLNIRPGQARVLELRYTAPSFLDAERLRFRYRLRGYDERWQDAAGRRVAFYTALPPGPYVFEVMAGNHHGFWSTSPVALAFRIQPLFHQTWLFRVLFASSVVAALYGLHSVRIRYLRQIQGHEQRQLLEAERRRIGKDLHDDLGADLTAIALQVELIQQTSSATGPTNPILDRIKTSARNLVDQLREVVWAQNPDCDTLDNLGTYLCAFTEDLLARAQVRCRLAIPPRLPNRFVSAEVRHNVLLAVKEALHNAVRHAQPSEVRLELAFDDAVGVLAIRVLDDGLGFTAPDVGSGGAVGGPPHGGTGLRNLRRRLADIGGRCEVTSAPGNGTQVCFLLPLQPPHR